MSVWESFAISKTGMDIEQLRAEVAAQNIAQANVPLSKNAPHLGGQKVVVLPEKAKFSKMFNTESTSHNLGGVSASVVQSDTPTRQVYDPNHPLANSKGYVNYLGVNTMEEMVTLTLAVRSYEANVTAFNSIRTMMQRALDIGGRNG